MSIWVFEFWVSLGFLGFRDKWVGLCFLGKFKMLGRAGGVLVGIANFVWLGKGGRDWFGRAFGVCGFLVWKFGNGWVEMFEFL